MLELAGWSVQDAKDLDYTASSGVALSEFPLKAGFADYMLFVDRQAVGIVEAKKKGTTLSGVDTQSKKYLEGLPAHVQRVGAPLHFAYESTGVQKVFRDVRDPDYRSRRVFSFHRPGTLLGWAREAETLRARLKEMPLLAKARSSPKASAACSRLPIRPSRSSAGCCALSSPVGISNHRQRSDPKSIFLDYHDTSPFERVSYPRQLRTWKVVHRHADPITTPQPAESVIQE